MHSNYIAVTKSLNTTPLNEYARRGHEMLTGWRSEKIAYSGILAKLTLLHRIV